MYMLWYTLWMCVFIMVNSKTNSVFTLFCLIYKPSNIEMQCYSKYPLKSKQRNSFHDNTVKIPTIKR